MLINGIAINFIEKPESVCFRSYGRPSTRIDVRQIVTDFPLYLTKRKYLPYQFVFVFFFISISFRMTVLSFIHSYCPDASDGESKEQKTKLCDFYPSDAFYLCRSIHMAVWRNAFDMHRDACRHQVSETNKVFFCWCCCRCCCIQREIKSWLLCAKKKSKKNRKKHMNAFYWWTAQINSERKLFRFCMHWSRAFSGTLV